MASAASMTALPDQRDRSQPQRASAADYPLSEGVSALNLNSLLCAVPPFACTAAMKVSASEEIGREGPLGWGVVAYDDIYGRLRVQLTMDIAAVLPCWRDTRTSRSS